MISQPPLANGRYRLLDVLGAGGMATVYAGWDELLQVHRAVKLLHPNMAANESIRRRFLSEARTMASLAHPNVVTVHDFGQEDQRIYIVMEWMGGGSLDDLLDRERTVHPKIVIDYLLPVLDALSAAHARGIVHRDIKPDNVLLTDRGTPKVSDFGIARVADMNRSLTRTGAAMGTWAYMAPEQRTDAKHADHRADIYAIGATLYNMTTGREPLDLYATNLHPELFRAVAEDLAGVIKRSTAYSPADRYQTVDELADALRELAEHYTDPGPVEIVVKPPPPMPQDEPLSAASGAAAAGGAVAAAIQAEEPKDTFFPGMWDDEDGHDSAGEGPSAGEPSKPSSETFTLAPEDNLSRAASFADEAPAPPKLSSETMALGPEDEPAVVSDTHVPAESSSSRSRWLPLAVLGVLLVLGVVGVGLVQLMGPDVALEVASQEGPAEPENTAAAEEPEPAPQEPAGVEPEPEPAVAAAEPAAPAGPAPAPVDEPDPAPVAAAAPAPVAKPKTGELFVNTLPPGQVSVDGGAMKGTPLLGEVLSTGGHQLILVGPAGQRAEQRIQIDAGESTRFCWDFNTGALCARR